MFNYFKYAELQIESKITVAARSSYSPILPFKGCSFVAGEREKGKGNGRVRERRGKLCYMLVELNVNNCTLYGQC